MMVTKTFEYFLASWFGCGGGRDKSTLYNISGMTKFQDVQHFPIHSYGNKLFEQVVHKHCKSIWLMKAYAIIWVFALQKKIKNSKLSILSQHNYLFLPMSFKC